MTRRPMPEPSDADRRKAARLDPAFAGARLIDALERGWEIGFRCQYCGAGKTWRRDTMLGRARRYLNCTMAEIQARLPCPRCPGRMPIMTMSGVIDPGDAEARRWATVSLLLDVGLNPTDYGYGWAPPGRQAGG
ncbi:MAG: hypothetical protein AB1542_07255 [Pseudomonadota bacterium]